MITTIKSSFPKKPKRGDVYYISSSTTVGHEQHGGRPAVVVSSNDGNEYSGVVEICYFTLQAKKPLPVHVPLTAGKCYGSTILCEQVTTVDQCRLGDYIETLSDDVMKQVDTALMHSLGLYTKESPDLSARVASSCEKLLEIEIAGMKDKIAELECEIAVREKMYNNLLNKFIDR